MSCTAVAICALSLLLVCLAAAVPRASAAVSGVAGGNGLLHIPSNGSLAHCPSSCFRQGFELNCDNTTQPPKLFLGYSSTTQILRIYPEVNYVSASAVDFNVTMRAGVDTYNMSWEAPVTGVAFDGQRSYLYAVGCGVDVYLLDHATNKTIGSCMSICVDDRVDMEKANVFYYCNGLGCCRIGLDWNVRAFGFRLGRLDGTIAQSDKVLSDIKVFLGSDYKFNTSDIYSSRVNTSKVGMAYFKIAITDQPSCGSAKRNIASYACNNESVCTNLPSGGGYSCSCSGDMLGNPYIRDGCQVVYLDAGYNPNPKGNCKRSCGNTNIPFPFGLEEGCYALERFRLNCTSENFVILGRGAVEYQVANVSVNEGYLHVNVLNSSGSNNQMREAAPSKDGGDMEEHNPLHDLFDLSEEFGMKMWWAVTNLTCPMAMSMKKRDTYAQWRSQKFYNGGAHFTSGARRWRPRRQRTGGGARRRSKEGRWAASGGLEEEKQAPKTPDLDMSKGESRMKIEGSFIVEALAQYKHTKATSTGLLPLEYQIHI